MRACDECGVEYSGDLRHCPLCGTPLQGDAVPPAFPVQQAKAPSKTARRVLGALTLMAMVAVPLAAATAESPLWPAVFTDGALLVNYLFLRNVIVHNPDFLRVAERWFLALLAVALLWWLATGAPWVVSLVVPGLCLAALVTNTVLVAVFRDRFVRGYAKYLLYDVALGFVPAVLVLAGWVQWPILAWASAGAAGVLTLSLLLLTRRQVAAEVRKLFTA